MLKITIGTAAVALFLAPAVACGAPSPDTSGGASESASEANVTSTRGLRGRYVTTSPGPILELAFRDERRAEVTWTSCGAGACTRASTYELRRSGTELRLTDAVSDEVTVLAFEALETSPGDSATRSLHPLDTALVDGGGGGLVQKVVDLISSFTAQSKDEDPQTFDSKEDPDDPTVPKPNQANTPESPYDCVDGLCVYDDSSSWQTF